ncbi:flagellar basal body-associated FliL family protein [Luteimonas sp. RD2P54]|uniref:Flagellar protein FliL n=1 Tax=Luteimonas endophytica TaxID=3042023 RepID=A0ABT6J847_9GAMM|nr:flagellar basal body-associated FliL family protein [Luteimonas endophytica]MDH5822770.1 flagellar basal body-associated FliL family protein [Luteimonas endophytica]
MAAAADSAKPQTAEPKKKGGRKRLIIIVAAVAAAAIAAGAAWFLLSRGAEPDPAAALPAPAQYFPLEPAFVVNLAGPAGGPRYLQVEVQLMTRDPVAFAELKQHAPAIRAHLLMLFSQQTSAGIADRAGRERLQAAALAEVRKLLEAETGRPGADALLFTSFVTQ